MNKNIFFTTTELNNRKWNKGFRHKPLFTTASKNDIRFKRDQKILAKAQLNFSGPVFMFPQFGEFLYKQSGNLVFKVEY